MRWVEVSPSLLWSRAGVGAIRQDRPRVGPPCHPSRGGGFLSKKPVEPTEDTTFGERLREIRKRRGLTQRELAEKLGMQQSMIAQYEGGHIRVNAAGLIARLARAFEHLPE